MLQILLLVVLIFINAFFSASEIALISLNKTKIKSKVKREDKKAQKILKLLENPSSFLATIQIGITLAGFLASAFAANAYAVKLAEHFSYLNISLDILKTIIVIFVTIILSYFTLVFGELVPKRLAMKNPYKIAYLVVTPITIISKLTYIFVLILTKSTNFITKLLKAEEDKADVLSEEEIKLLITESLSTGALEENETKLIFNVFEFNDTTIKQIMTPKSKMILVDVNSSFKDIFDIIKKYKYTRFPVYSKSKDNIIGILNVKDIILNYSKDDTIVTIKKLLRKPFFTKLENKIDDVFKEMQDKNEAMAIVRNGKKVVGLVTLEDLIEEIVGNIFDEYDDEEDKKR